MAYAGEDKGKDGTLLEAVRELEKGVERMMQILEINSPIATEEKAPYAPCQGAASQKIQDAIHRLGITRRQVAEGTDFVERLISTIG